MKILKLDICFKLPDDYNSSDLNDALEELIKYRKNLNLNENPNEVSDNIIDEKLSVYDNWWNLIHTTSMKLHGSVSICALENNEWKPIE